MQIFAAGSPAISLKTGSLPTQTGSTPPLFRLLSRAKSERATGYKLLAIGYGPQANGHRPNGYFIGFFARSSATISAAASRARSLWSGGKLIAPTRACPPPP